MPANKNPGLYRGSSPIAAEPRPSLRLWASAWARPLADSITIPSTLTPAPRNRTFLLGRPPDISILALTAGYNPFSSGEKTCASEFGELKQLRGPIQRRPGAADDFRRLVIVDFDGGKPRGLQFNLIRDLRAGSVPPPGTDEKPHCGGGNDSTCDQYSIRHGVLIVHERRAARELGAIHLWLTGPSGNLQIPSFGERRIKLRSGRSICHSQTYHRAALSYNPLAVAVSMTNCASTVYKNDA
jgi:hypothetical protein